VGQKQNSENLMLNRLFGLIRILK